MLLLVLFSYISDVSGELDATEMGLSLDVSVWGELFTLLLVLLLVSFDVSGELDATERGLSIEVPTRGGLFVLLLSSPSSLASSGVSSEGGGDERSGLLSLVEPTEGVEAVLLVRSKEQNNKLMYATFPHNYGRIL